MQFCIRMASQIDQILSSVEKNDPLYFVALVE